MDLGNWLGIATFLLTSSAGFLLRWLLKRALRGAGGFEGIVTERGAMPTRHKMDVEEEIAHLESILGKK